MSGVEVVASGEAVESSGAGPAPSGREGPAPSAAGSAPTRNRGSASG
ncbi:Uncharacterised protein [Mycobacterium tuberculosis]|nr:Uncharacterised protein [Mycobacterium tuberculosis]